MAKRDTTPNRPRRRVRRSLTGTTSEMTAHALMEESALQLAS
jgi:hypothetical protein